MFVYFPVYMAVLAFAGQFEDAVGAPSHKARTRSHPPAPHTVYDQKQTGEYNVQLHLKDFQIIALLGDESLAGLGDYDYSYDYSDFTVKPQLSTKPTSTTPQQFSSLSSAASTTVLISSTTRQPSLQTQKPLPVEENDSKPKPPSNVYTSTTTEKDLLGELSPSKPQEDQSPNKGQIMVQILEGPSSNPPIISSEQSVKDQEKNVEEVVQIKRCLSGFYRDNNGKCRRIKRPQAGLPLGLGRLAQLAARFRGTENSSSFENGNS